MNNKTANEKLIAYSIFSYMHNFGKTTKEAADNFAMKEPDLVRLMTQYPDQRATVLERKNKKEVA